MMIHVSILLVNTLYSNYIESNRTLLLVMFKITKQHHNTFNVESNYQMKTIAINYYKPYYSIAYTHYYSHMNDIQ